MQNRKRKKVAKKRRCPSCGRLVSNKDEFLASGNDYCEYCHHESWEEMMAEEAALDPSGPAAYHRSWR